MAAEKFFPEIKRELELLGATILSNKENEKRHKLDFVMPLTGQPLVGMPSYIGDAFESLSKSETLDKASSVVELEGMTIEIYDSPESPRNLLITRALLKKFQVFRDSDNTIKLAFSCYIPDDRKAWAWVREYFNSTFYAKFEQAQQELNLDAASSSKQSTLEANKTDDSGQWTPGEAVKPEHDGEFTAPLAANGKGKNKAAAHAH